MNEERTEQFADLIDEIGSQAADFAYDKKINDFELTVRITCNGGWCSADIMSID